MAADPALPLAIRGRVLSRELRKALRNRRPRRGLRALAGFAFPGRWPAPPEARQAALDEAVRAGDVAAAGVTLAERDDAPDGLRPGSPAALRRARAMALLATGKTGRERETDQSVVAYLRGEFGPQEERGDGARARGEAPDGASAPTAAALAATAAAAVAEELRAAGHGRPRILATIPGFKTNPYGRLMEQAYEQAGLAAVAVERAEEIEEVVARSRSGGYEVVIHVNAPDRLVRDSEDRFDAAGVAERVLGDIDRWMASGAGLIMTIHNGPRLQGARGDAERLVAQGIADRAGLVHVLSAGTPATLADWITVDSSRTVLIPHPSYDGAYGPGPDRGDARRALGFDDGDVVAGLIGTLAWRKEAELLIEALATVPDPLPDGRRLRLLLAGMLIGTRGETLIRRAMADSRVVARFGYVPDVLIPGLLAALDVAVVPYERFLNSGWLHLALTAGVPAIASDGGNAAEVVRPAALRTFRAGDAGSLAARLAAAGELTTPDARAAARESVAELDPGVLSARFVAAVIEATSPEAGLSPASTDAPGRRASRRGRR